MTLNLKLFKINFNCLWFFSRLSKNMTQPLTNSLAYFKSMIIISPSIVVSIFQVYNKLYSTFTISKYYDSMLGKYHQSGFETFLNISFVGVHECLLAKRLFAIIIHCLIFCLCLVVFLLCVCVDVLCFINPTSRTEIIDGSDFKIFRKHVRIFLSQYSMYLCFIYIIIIIIVRLSVCWSVGLS